MVDFKKCVVPMLLALSSCSYLQIMDDPAPQAGSSVAVQEVNIWPVRNAPEILSVAKPNAASNAQDNEGKAAQFVAGEEYLSATSQRCRKYYVNLSLYLACYGDNWYPVRVF